MTYDEEYTKLQQQILELRTKPDHDEREEDRLMDRMDWLWYKKLTPEERDRQNKKGFTTH